MLFVYARCVVQKDRVEEFKAFATELVEKTRKEAGCVSYELVQVTGKDDNLFAFVEKWENSEYLNIHANSEHFTTLIPKISAFTELEIISHKVII